MNRDELIQLQEIEARLNPSDEHLALSAVHRQIAEAKDLMSETNIQGRIRLGFLLEEVILIERGDTEVIANQADSERVRISENKRQADLDVLRAQFNQTQTLPVSLEQHRAFKTVHDNLVGLAGKYGKPVMAIGESASGFVSMDATACTSYGRIFTSNARQISATFIDKWGEARRGAGVIITDEAVKTVGKIASFEIWDGTSGSHPATIYKLYPDRTIELLVRSCTDDGDDEEGYPINWTEHIDRIGWLNLEQMEDLRRCIGTATL